MAELLDAEVEIVVLVLISTRSEQSETEEDVRNIPLRKLHLFL
jgi:hypothetical protein